MSRVTVICPSCIGLGKVMHQGNLHSCTRCHEEGRIAGIERRNIYGHIIGYEPDPEA